MKKIRNGFTLIEVMVATAVLLIMVVMIGSLFRQATSSWDAGYARSEGGMIIRSVVGAMTRDLSSVIDGRAATFGLSEPVEITDTSVAFIILANNAETGKRDVRKIEYSGGTRCTRDESALNDNGTWSKISSTTIWNGNNATSQSGASMSAKIEFLPMTPPGNPGTTNRAWEKHKNYQDVAWGEGNTGSTHPLGVRVRLSLAQAGAYNNLEVRSYGPDGVKNGSSGSDDDDIIFH